MEALINPWKKGGRRRGVFVFWHRYVFVCVYASANLGEKKNQCFVNLCIAITSLLYFTSSVKTWIVNYFFFLVSDSWGFIADPPSPTADLCNDYDSFIWRIKTLYHKPHVFQQFCCKKNYLDFTFLEGKIQFVIELPRSQALSGIDGGPLVMEWVTHPWDVFHMSIRGTAQWQRRERGGPWLLIPNILSHLKLAFQISSLRLEMVGNDRVSHK